MPGPNMFGRWHVSQPMLGERPMLISYVVTILGAIGGWALAFVFYAYFRRRIAYWL